MVSSAFAVILKSGREDFNTQFVLAKRQYPGLEGEAFSQFLVTTVGPLVDLVNSTNPDVAVSVAQAAYEVGLELVAQRLAGPQARENALQKLWQEGFSKMLPHLTASPRRVIGALSNAAHQLDSTPGAMPERWLTLLEKAGSLASSVDEFLKAGQVAAWRCGMAHYRESALAVAAGLPAALALQALDDDTAPERWQELLQRLQSDRWNGLPDASAPLDQSSRAAPGRASRLVLRTGSFRGFGGLFPEPPRVVVGQDQVYVRSGTEGWLLTADAFGATFHRATEEELAAASPQIPQVPHGIEVPPDVGQITSVARLDHTVALTGTLTHAVLLYALPENGGSSSL